MSVERSVFTTRRFQCEPCGRKIKQLCWDYDAPPACVECAAQMTHDAPPANAAHTVIGDECDVWVRHGLCHEDGSPKRFTSKQAMREEARAKGLEPAVRHTPLPGTDKNPHTQRFI